MTHRPAYAAQMSVLRARLRRAAVKRVRQRHPWVFDQSITHLSREGEPGETVVLYDDKRKQIGLGLYDPKSPIRVRVMHHGGPISLDDAFFAQRLKAAWEAREPLLESDTDGYRVVHGENDGLGGLVVDRYASTLVVKLYSDVWWPRLDLVLRTLEEGMRPERIVLRLARNVAAHRAQDGDVVVGGPVDVHQGQHRVPFRENGLWFLADPIRGQKTGFFLDQRDNRMRVGDMSHGKRVLNVFSYSGGFSLYAARGGATEVVSLDLSQPALDDAERHFAANNDDNNVSRCIHRTVQGDAFAEMRKLAQRDERFDVVVVDPPSFAKRASEVEGALNSYRRLMRLALDLLEPDGRLVFASCSSRVDKDAFCANALEGAEEAGARLVVDDVTGHAMDHPVGFAEAAYLKAMFCRRAL